MPENRLVDIELVEVLLTAFIFFKSPHPHTPTNMTGHLLTTCKSIQKHKIIVTANENI